MASPDEPYVNPLLEEAFAPKSKGKKSAKKPVSPMAAKPNKRKMPQNNNTNGLTKKRLIIASLIAVAFLIVISPLPTFASVKISELTSPSQIKNIANNSGFSLQGKRLFYDANPELVDADMLDAKCPNDGNTIEFGCYKTGENKMYILKAPKDTYIDEEYTTAAHETLHAAWANMSDSERAEVSSKLKTLYADKNNPTTVKLSDELKSYGSDETVITDELHSFLGSEFVVADVSPELSEYYNKYFIDQSVPSQANDRFNTTFSDVAAGLDTQYNNLEKLISDIDAYKVAHLDNITAAMNRASYYGDTYSYNRNVDAFNHNRIYYNNQVDYFNNLKAQYNQDVEDYNALLQEFYPSRARAQVFAQ